jgi:hypothetical protein
MMTRILLAFTLLTVTTSAHGKPPFAGDPLAEEVGPRPASRKWNLKEGNIVLSFLFEPGIPNVDQLTTITVVAQRQKGRSIVGRQRLEGADIELTFKTPDGRAIGRYQLHANPMSRAKYATHFTPTAEGVHEIVVSGKTADGTPLGGTLALPVDVWPLPEELEGTGAKIAGGGARAPVVRGPVEK